MLQKHISKQKKANMINRIFEILNIYVLSTSNLNYLDHASHMEAKKMRREIDSKQTPHMI